LFGGRGCGGVGDGGLSERVIIVGTRGGLALDREGG